MSEFIERKQFFIATKDAKPMGKMGMANILDVEMVKFFDEIAKAALTGEHDDVFAIQWAISKLDEDERNAVKAGKEEYREKH